MKYKSTIQILNHTMSEQQKDAHAFLCIILMLAKHMKHFTDVNIEKEYMLNVMNVLFENKNDVIESFQLISISTSTYKNNSVILSDNNHKLLKQMLSTADFY